MYCDVEMLPVIASFADIYEPAAIYDDPRAGFRHFTGDYYCPKCRHVNCWIPRNKEEIKKYAEWFKIHLKDLEKVLPRVRQMIEGAMKA